MHVGGVTQWAMTYRWNALYYRSEWWQGSDPENRKCRSKIIICDKGRHFLMLKAIVNNEDITSMTMHKTIKQPLLQNKRQEVHCD